MISPLYKACVGSRNGGRAVVLGFVEGINDIVFYVFSGISISGNDLN